MLVESLYLGENSRSNKMKLFDKFNTRVAATS